MNSDVESPAGKGWPKRGAGTVRQALSGEALSSPLRGLEGRPQMSKVGRKRLQNNANKTELLHHFLKTKVGLLN